MAKRHLGHGSARPRSEPHVSVTKAIITELRSGIVPWVAPFDHGDLPIALPFNICSLRPYSGANIIAIWRAAVKRPRPQLGVLTFRQARSLGGSVSKGEHGTFLTYTHWAAPKRELRRAEAEGRQPIRNIPFLREFPVFFADQCEGLPANVITLTSSRASRCDDLSSLVGKFPAAENGEHPATGTHRTHDSNVHDDAGALCNEAQFYEQAEELLRCALRVSRPNYGIGRGNAFDADGVNQLVAELGTAFVCAAIGVRPTLLRPELVDRWVEALAANNRTFVRAANAASRATLIALKRLGSREPNSPNCPAGRSATGQRGGR